MNGLKYRVMLTFAVVALAAGCKSNSTSPNNSSANSGANNVVRESIYVGDKLYIAGDFDSVGGNFIQWIAMWDGSKWTTVGSPVPSISLTVSGIESFASDGASLYAGGNFEGQFGSADINEIARWDGNQWYRIDPPAGTVHQIAFNAGMLYAYPSGQSFAKYDGTSWIEIPSGFIIEAVDAIAASNSNFWAVSSSAVGSSSSTDLWKYDGAWSKQGGAFASSTPDSAVAQLATSGSDVYAVGNFSEVGSTQLTSYGVAKWDGTQWSSLGTLSGTNKVTAVAVDPTGNLYIGEPNALMEYNGTSWTTVATTAGGFGNAGTIRTIAVTANHLAIGGDFTSVNGSTANYVSILR